MTSRLLRVLVVEDSLTVRRAICEALESDPSVAVVGEADNGLLGVELCRTLRPDVVTLDMQLPVMSGLSATEQIMAHCPTPILIVSASTNRGDLFETYDALAAGAVDILEKPRVGESEADWEQRLIAAVRLVARIKVITHPRARLGLARRVPPPPPPSGVAAATSAVTAPSVVALGASTGGPSALSAVLVTLPRKADLLVLVVLHIDEPFGAAFAEWLGQQTRHEVRFATGGEPLEGRGMRVLMAPPGRHLLAQGTRLLLGDSPPRHSCRPSIDVLYESLAVLGPRCAAALLTGMGRDGAEGLLSLRRAGAFTVAQDESSSVVWGMPREAVLLGAACRVLPLDEIGPCLAGRLEGGEEGGWSRKS